MLLFRLISLDYLLLFLINISALSNNVFDINENIYVIKSCIYVMLLKLKMLSTIHRNG